MYRRIFFIFIFEEFFLEPDYSTLITSMIIGKETKNNLKIIFEIWKEFVYFKLFPNNNEFAIYTPFNWYFIETIEKIFDLCEKILNFNLPDSLIDYDNYENNNEILDDTNKIKNNTFTKKSTLYSYSVCYNISDLTTLLNIIKNNTNYIFENKKNKNEISEFEVVYKNIKDKRDVVKRLKSGNENIINYYIYYEIFYSRKFQDILFKTIKQEEIFNIKEIKNPKNEKEKYLNKIIRIKNLLTELLFKSDNLSKIKFIKQNIDYNNTKEIFQELSEYYKNKSTLYKCYSQSSSTDIDIDYNDIYIDNSYLNNINPENNGLPLYWYSNTILTCFQELEQDKINNNVNYIYIFNSLKDEIINCINKYNFEDLGIALESLKNMRYYINDYKENQDKFKDLIINTDIRNFMENEKIEVVIKFIYNKEEKYINIIKKEESLNFKFESLDNFNDVDQKDNDVINCSNISEFIENFPSFILFAKKNKIRNVFKIEKEIKIKKNLINYLKIVKEHLINKFNSEEINEVYSKIKKRIMTKLYDKLFPKKENVEDEKFYQQCLCLSWIEPKHLKQENLFIDNFLPITNNYFEQINNEKSAVGKLEILSKIFDAINSVIIFNKGGNFSTDDIAPIFEYALIKAHPKRLSSNIQFLQIFMKKNEELKERMYFDYLKAYMNIIINANYSHFYDVTEEEFNSKCNESLEKKYEFV